MFHMLLPLAGKVYKAACFITDDSAHDAVCAVPPPITTEWAILNKSLCPSTCPSHALALDDDSHSVCPSSRHHDRARLRVCLSASYCARLSIGSALDFVFPIAFASKHLNKLNGARGALALPQQASAPTNPPPHLYLRLITFTAIALALARTAMIALALARLTTFT